MGILVPAGETARRIQQLLIERVTKGQIARALGYRWPILRLHTKPGGWVTLRTALRIKRLHRLATAARSRAPADRCRQNARIRADQRAGHTGRRTRARNSLNTKSWFRRDGGPWSTRDLST
jgi:hypothetical protein